MKLDSREKWAEGMRAFETEAAHGRLDCYLIAREDSMSVLEAAILGDHVARRAIQGITGWVERLTGRPLCMCCDHEFGATTEVQAFCVVMPVVGVAEGHVIVTGICEPCFARGNDDAGRMTMATTALREVWPELRVVPDAEAQVGHA